MCPAVGTRRSSCVTRKYHFVIPESVKIVTIVGARPQFIKAGPVSKAIASHNSSTQTNDLKLEEILVHTGQHYDPDMSAVFFESLNLKVPKYNLAVGSGTHGRQIARILERLEDVLRDERPDTVLVYGDTNSTFAAAIVASRLHIPIAHVEAGLRSFNRLMPEESNRVLTDHLSSLLFAPTATGIENLKNEGITKGVYLVGDVMHEAALEYGEVAQRESTILTRLKLSRKGYSLVTLHRAENTDNTSRMDSIIEALVAIGRTRILVWPVHPRTRQCLTDAHMRRLEECNIVLINPASYLDMLLLEKEANVILTDSGGVQKEAMWFGVPCITMRDESEWLETVQNGWNQVVGTGTAGITDAFENAMNPVSRPKEVPPPDYLASELIVERIWAHHWRANKQLVSS
jgi:UDP-GlcNAc3NAcA epimerase